MASPKSVTVLSTKVLSEGINGHGRWTLRQVFLEGDLDLDGLPFDAKTFDDRIPDEGLVRVLVQEKPPQLGRCQLWLKRALS